jgi:hypothetical protein
MAVLSLSEILRNDIQKYLGGSDSVLIKTIQDLSSRVGSGMDRVQVPLISGLATSNVASGTKQSADSVTFTSDVLLLDQVKESYMYISFQENEESAVDIKAAFLDAAPRQIANSMEAAIAAQLAGASTNDFDSASATAGVFAIDDIANAKKLLDQANVPTSDRYMAVNADSMELLSSFSEFEDGSKGLSAEALRDGIVSRVKGFNVIQSEDVGSTTAANNEIHFYHKEAVAFAMQREVHFVEQREESYGQEFIALRTKYGVKALNEDVLKLTMALTTATS